MTSIVELLREKGVLNDNKATAKELAHIATGRLKRFDAKFRSVIQNKCGCKIGGTQLELDYNSVFESIRAFMESIANVTKCPVNEFLDVENPVSRASKLLQNAAAARTTAGSELKKIADGHHAIDCKNCRKIGDVVIALEQPRLVPLVCIDEAFDDLCAATGREVKPLKSYRAALRQAGMSPPPRGE